MSELDTLIIDTGANIVKEERIEPLPLFDEKHPMLAQKIPEYTQAIPNQNMTNLVKRLKMTMKLYGGVGLSANQCGIFERVFVIGTDQFQIACINPKVISSTADLTKENEGCLSFPGLFVKIERPVGIDVQFYTETGELKQLHLDGLTARCFLHELDHMNGVKFTERAGKVSLQLARQRQQKLIKKMVRQRKNNGVFV